MHHKLNLLIIGDLENRRWPANLRERMPETTISNAPDEKVALANFAHNPDLYDAVIVDTDSSQVDEEYLVVGLRQLNLTIPIIIYSSAPTWKRVRTAFKLGANSYLENRGDTGELEESLTRLLEL